MKQEICAKLRKKAMKQPSYYIFLGRKTLTFELKALKLKPFSMIDFTDKNLASLLTFSTKKDSNFAIICNNNQKHVTEIHPYHRRKSY